jgi:hypothetical protein
MATPVKPSPAGRPGRRCSRRGDAEAGAALPSGVMPNELVCRFVAQTGGLNAVGYAAASYAPFGRAHAASGSDAAVA